MKECWNRFENLINRNISIFCIEAIPKKKSQLFFRKKIGDRKKKSENIFSKSENPKISFSKSQNLKIQIFDFLNFRILRFWKWNFRIFRFSDFEKIFFRFFFSAPKKNQKKLRFFFGIQHRCKKLRSFDLWGFQSDSSTLSSVLESLLLFSFIFFTMISLLSLAPQEPKSDFAMVFNTKKIKKQSCKKIQNKISPRKKKFFFKDFFYIKHKVSAFQRNQLELLGVSGSETARETKQWPPPEHSSQITVFI